MKAAVPVQSRMFSQKLRALDSKPTGTSPINSCMGRRCKNSLQLLSVTAKCFTIPISIVQVQCFTRVYRTLRTLVCGLRNSSLWTVKFVKYGRRMFMLYVFFIARWYKLNLCSVINFAELGSGIYEVGANNFLYTEPSLSV